MVYNPKDLERVKAQIEKADLTPVAKAVYLETLMIDPALLQRTGAHDTVQGLRYCC